MNTTNTSLKQKSSQIFIIFANLLTIIAAVLFRWDVFLIMFLFWMESVFIGVFNIFRLYLSSSHRRPGSPGSSKKKPEDSPIFLSIFFAIHYNIFNLVHLFFIIMLAIIASALPGELMDSVEPKLWLNVSDFHWSDLDHIALIILFFFRHLSDFIVNDISSKRYLEKSPMQWMFYPYRRIFLMHFTILIGGAAFFAAILFELSLFAYIILAVFIFFKMLFDLKENKRNRATSEIFSPRTDRNKIKR